MKYKCNYCKKIFKIPITIKKRLLNGIPQIIFCPFCYSAETYNIGK